MDWPSVLNALSGFLSNQPDTTKTTPAAVPPPSSPPPPQMLSGIALVMTILLGLFFALITIWIMRRLLGYLSWLGVKLVAMIEVWTYIVIFIATTYCVTFYFGASHHLLTDFHQVIHSLLQHGLSHGRLMWTWAKS
jgi:hypothetical protein